MMPIPVILLMSEDQTRRFEAIANAIRADVIVLTGDFVTWDPSAETAVVHALEALKAPFGVFGFSGNHEAWSQTKDSITGLFARAGIRMLRDVRMPITTAGEQF